LEEDDDMNENVNDEDIEDEDVEIEVDDDVELIFPYEVEGDQTSPLRDESSDFEPPNAELSDSESEDEEIEVAPEVDVAPEPTVGTATQRLFAIRDFLRDLLRPRWVPTVLRLLFWTRRSRLKILECGENATLKKKLKDKEMQLVIARMDCASAERRLHESIGWNRRFYGEMVRKGTVPKPPSDDEDDGRPRKKSKKSDRDDGPSKLRGPPSDSL
ncbi:hypothetical protein Tco_0043860, partial [Tanacetum coccineum]